MERCGKHNNNYIDMYCQNHNGVDCPTSMAIDHRSSRNTFDRPEFHQNNASTPMPKEMQERVAATLTEHHDNLQHQKQKKHKTASNVNQRSVLHLGTQEIYSVKVRSDGKKCDIVSACTLEDGTIILSDRINMKLKRLDSSTFTVTDFCDLPGEPWQVCPISNQEVAVCLYRNAVVQFISVGASLKKTKQIHTVGGWGLAYCNGNLYTSNRTSVSIYSLSSSKPRQLFNPPEQQLFSDIRSLAVSKDGSKIYVSDYDKGLIIMDNKGQVIGRYLSGRYLRYAFGCYLTATESLLVCGYSIYNVLQFGPDGELIGKIVEHQIRKRHQAVCCNPQMSKMIVGSWQDNNIEVYDMV